MRTWSGCSRRRSASRRASPRRPWARRSFEPSSWSCCGTRPPIPPGPCRTTPGPCSTISALADCNLKLPLWQVVRASTAAPTFFPPEVVRVGQQEFVFVDGGVTVFNNPAFQLFLHGDGGRLPSELARGRGQDAAGLDRHRLRPECQREPQAGRDELALQRDEHTLGPDGGRERPAGLPLPDVRPLPARSSRSTWRSATCSIPAEEVRPGRRSCSPTSGTTST